MWNYTFFCFNRVNRKQIKFNGQKLHRNRKKVGGIARREKKKMKSEPVHTPYHEIWKKCKLTK